MRFNKKLEQLRTQKGLTQHELAELTGISIPAIEKYENGQSEPTPDLLNRLADALDVHSSELIVHTKRFHTLLQLINDRPIPPYK